jgi:glyoxylase-like metal-dependent hydrolase (beta-lactamase superfamily II)
MTYLADLYVEDARRVLGDREPELLFLTHAHFDHCGSAHALLQAFPGLRVAASAYAAEILSRPRALDRIRALNEDARGLAPLVGARRSSPAPFHPFPVDRIMNDGDEVDLGGGLSVQVIATPGHTRDFLSYYIPQRRILVASEAVGCEDVSGQIMVEFVADYDAYLASLRRLAELEIDVLCPGHVHVFVGADARGYIERSLHATERYREWVEALLADEGGDVGRVVARVKASEWDPAPQPKQPEQAYLLNTEARVRVLAARLSG